MAASLGPRLRVHRLGRRRRARQRHDQVPQARRVRKSFATDFARRTAAPYRAAVGLSGWAVRPSLVMNRERFVTGPLLGTVTWVRALHVFGSWIRL